MQQTADQRRAEQTRKEIREEEAIRRKRRYKIDISEQERYMLLRPLEKLLPNERTPQEKVFLQFLEDLPKNNDGSGVIKSPGTKKRTKKPTTNKSRRSIPMASKLAKKAQKAKKYGGGSNKPPKPKPIEVKKRGKKKTTSTNTNNKPPKQRRSSWRGV